MPTALTPSEALPLPRWQRPARTAHDLPWAEIKVLDLSTFDLPGGKEKLAEELREAVRKSPTPPRPAPAHFLLPTREV